MPSTAFGGLANHGERFRQDRFERRPAGDLLLELGRLGGELRVRELLHRRLERVHALDGAAVLLEEAVVATAEDGLESGIEHEGSRRNAKTARSGAAEPLIIRDVGAGTAPYKSYLA
jgi:hypothetical protein